MERFINGIQNQQECKYKLRNISVNLEVESCLHDYNQETVRKNIFQYKTKTKISNKQLCFTETNSMPKIEQARLKKSNKGIKWESILVKSK